MSEITERDRRIDELSREKTRDELIAMLDEFQEKAMELAPHEGQQEKLAMSRAMCLQDDGLLVSTVAAFEARIREMEEQLEIEGGA
jgi:ABC-type polar amino acid transport system ATPase subunit